MKFDDSAYAQLCDSLRQEAGEQVEHIGAVLLTLERGEPGAPREKLLDDAFRQAHNLKGAASSLAFGVTAHLAHEIESMLAALRRGTIADPRRAYDALHGSLTAVAAALAADPAGPVPPVVKDALDVLGAALAAAGAPDPSATPVPVSSAGAATSAVSKAPALPPSQSSVSSVSAVSPVPGAPPSPPAAPS
jgi:chemotaxis protein histidine kinase CheA